MGIRKKRTAGSIVCILFTALFSVLAVSGCAKTEDAAAGSVEQEEQEVQIGLSFESFVIGRRSMYRMPTGMWRNRFPRLSISLRSRWMSSWWWQETVRRCQM